MHLDINYENSNRMLCFLSWTTIQKPQKQPLFWCLIHTPMFPGLHALALQVRIETEWVMVHTGDPLHE